MNVTFDLTIHGLIGLVIAGIGFFATVTLLLAVPAGQPRPWLLCGFIGGLSFAVLSGFLHEIGVLQSPLVFILTMGLPFTAAPCLYLYARQARTPGLEASDWRHLLPVGLGGATVILWLLVGFPAGESKFPIDVGLLYTWMLYGFSVLYALLTLRLIGQYHAALKQVYSEPLSRRLNWITGAALGLLVLIGTDLVLGMLLDRKAVSIETLRFVISSLTLVVVFALVLQALRRPAEYISHLPLFEKEPKSRYATSGLREDTLVLWAERLHKAMEADNIYLLNELSLPQLAEHIRIKPHHLSQLLNQHIGQNFYDFINQARIGHACRLLQKADQSVLDIAFASGYNNKVSFYNAFKQFMGETPGNYRQRSASPKKNKGNSE